MSTTRHTKQLFTNVVEHAHARNMEPSSSNSRNQHLLASANKPQNNPQRPAHRTRNIHNKPLRRPSRIRTSMRSLVKHWGKLNRTRPQTLSTVDGGGSNRNLDPQTTRLRARKHSTLRTPRTHGPNARQDRTSRKPDSNRTHPKQRINRRHLLGHRWILSDRHHVGTTRVPTSINKLEAVNERSQQGRNTTARPRQKPSPLAQLSPVNLNPQDVHSIAHRSASNSKNRKKVAQLPTVAEDHCYSGHHKHNCAQTSEC